MVKIHHKIVSIVVEVENGHDIEVISEVTKFIKERFNLDILQHHSKIAIDQIKKPKKD